ncbi:MAG: hypothetical protein ABIS38_04320 [Sphingomicrobium sp.]
MSRALIAFALLVPVAATHFSAPAPALCIPAPPRTTPHRKLDRVDKWRHDERTIV